MMHREWNRTIANEGRCADAKAELLCFQKNDAVESMRESKLDALGFWTPTNDNISVDVMPPPFSFKDQFPHAASHTSPAVLA